MTALRNSFLMSRLVGGAAVSDAAYKTVREDANSKPTPQAAIKKDL